MNCPYLQEIEGSPCASYIQGGFCKRGDHFRCVEYLLNREPELSYSSIRDFSKCRRSFWFSYVCGLEPIEAQLPLPVLQGKYVDLILSSIHSGHGIPDIDLSAFKDDEGNLPGYLEALTAIMEAYYITPQWMLKGLTQYEFKWHEDGYPRIHGFLDLYDKDENMGAEFKYTSRPENYDKFTMQDQLGTYFLGIPSMQKMLLRTITVPTIRLGKKETNADFHQRVLNDVAGSPKHYVKDTYFYRNEFDLEAIKERSMVIWEDIRRYLETGGMYRFFQTTTACFSPSVCFYLSICENGVISDLLYKKRDPNERR